MSKLKIAIVCRDGWKVRNFVNEHNLMESDWFRVRSMNDLKSNINIKGFILMKPYPDHHTLDAILTYFELNEYKQLKL